LRSGRDAWLTSASNFRPTFIRAWRDDFAFSSTFAFFIEKRGVILLPGPAAAGRLGGRARDFIYSLPLLSVGILP
jgi:hypothetical protein